ncbi:MAG: Sulfite reductase [NADPH] flavoprotein alpha-component [Flavobacterium sp. SCGC AAA160-P02]|nr:MAG: Sulfite reductase [NADPH] flavoprotein alpha-component [Flavobacterium sp. SCGC AAA160-P02]
MVFSIWRFSHLALAISSFIFIFIASVTGIILSVEPMSEQVKPYSVDNLEKISLAKTISTLKNEYDEIISIEKDHNNFIIGSVITKTGSSERFYINPNTGKKIGSLIEKAPIYKFATNLHRSLFLKTTGRIIIGIVSFLLLLIAVTGLLLIIKRQGGITKIFSKVVNEDFYQYYHVTLGRFSLLPIIIITITGVYLSLETFSFFPKEEITHQIKLVDDNNTKIKTTEFEVFRNTPLKKLKILEFPFSKDDQDYFYLKLKDREIVVHQYSGIVLSNVQYPFFALASSLSLFLHTGRGSFFWSLVLLLSSASILFFIFSGFAMTFQRRKNNKPIPINIFDKTIAEYVILVGSETGNTYQLANLLFDALNKAQKKVFITDLNQYTSFKNLKHLFVLTSTYGKGDAPTNANTFLQKLNAIPLSQKVNFSVVGFGSLAYPDYCQFAIDINNTLLEKLNFKQTVPLHKIHNQNFNDFLTWANTWSKETKTPIELKEIQEVPKDVVPFKVVNRSHVNDDQTFLLKLKSTNKEAFKSGDLLEIYPKEETKARQYSIAAMNNEILLSIKKHTHGVCSTYLSDIKKGGTCYGRIQKNKTFHFPNRCKEVILISNGTGIAPFLGMIHENTKCIKTHLFWGGRNKSSYNLYRDLVTKAIQNKQLKSVNIAYSRESTEKKYVQHLIEENPRMIERVLSQNGVIMICGSIVMESDVKEVLDSITVSKLNSKLSKFSNQIKSDCY